MTWVRHGRGLGAAGSPRCEPARYGFVILLCYGLCVLWYPECECPWHHVICGTAADGVPVLRISALKQTVRGSAPGEVVSAAQAVLADPAAGEDDGTARTGHPLRAVPCYTRVYLLAHVVMCSCIPAVILSTCHVHSLLPRTSFDFERPWSRGGLAFGCTPLAVG